MRAGQPSASTTLDTDVATVGAAIAGRGSRLVPVVGLGRVTCVGQANDASGDGQACYDLAFDPRTWSKIAPVATITTALSRTSMVASLRDQVHGLPSPSAVIMTRSWV